MNKQKYIAQTRQRRRFHSRKRVRGDAARPRLCIYRSHRNIGAQIIDDEQGKTLVAAHTNEKDLRAQFSAGGNCDAAKELGKVLAERALAAGIKEARFDRGHCRYHGRVAALADGAREAGLVL